MLVFWTFYSSKDPEKKLYDDMMFSTKQNKQYNSFQHWQQYKYYVTLKSGVISAVNST